jgi:hypothetical protein
MFPAPRHLKAFSGAEHRWFDRRDGYIYEWDYRHGRIERYDTRGNHLGEFDPETGEMTKPPNPEQKTEI